MQFTHIFAQQTQEHGGTKQTSLRKKKRKNMKKNEKTHSFFLDVSFKGLSWSAPRMESLTPLRRSPESDSIFFVWKNRGESRKTRSLLNKMDILLEKMGSFFCVCENIFFLESLEDLFMIEVWKLRVSGDPSFWAGWTCHESQAVVPRGKFVSSGNRFFLVANEMVFV